MQGLTVGGIGTLLVGSLVIFGLRDGVGASGVPALDEMLAWVYANLGLSLPVFALLIGLYARSLRRLKRAVSDDAPIEEVAQCDQLVDIWTSLFFGVGVIWTAIGMRSALVYALGDPQATLNAGAHVILERMVEGGILLALSTTIFGGVGGYGLRVLKALTVDTELKRYYDRLAHAPSRETLTTLRAIEWHLHQLTCASARREESEHGQAGVAFIAPRRS